MAEDRKAVFFAVGLVVCLFLIPFTALADPNTRLPFEPDDTLEEIRAKIEHNGYDFTVRHNWVFDMSSQEKEGFFSRHAPVDIKSVVEAFDAGPLAEELGKALPLSFDWRNHGGRSYIGPIRNQRGCGSCYAFGACAAAEGTYNRAAGRYGENCADFSESYIIWCLARLPQYISHFFGCDGADYTYSELDALTLQGVTYEGYFPYTTSDPGS